MVPFREPSLIAIWLLKNKVPRFRNFINELNEETKRRIETIGYRL